ncbi:MAG: endolytic transglycosylase MltG [Bacteroidales bacterium]|nr:endolytic transglycosylase MltG [Bacteroidales bacterium]
MTYYHSRYGTATRRKKSRFGKVIYTILFILILGALGLAYQLWVTIFKPNTWVPDNEPLAFYVPSGTDYDELKSLLYSHGVIINRKTFEWLAEKKKLTGNVKPGKYMIESGLNNNEVINLLRGGQQTPVKLIFNNIRTKQELAQSISSQIEADSLSIIRLLNDSSYLKVIGFNPQTVLALFIPNTYEVYWTMTAREFIDRMYMEYNKFWTTTRISKAEAIGLTPVEVSTLASIVDKETTKVDEMPAIAGVYTNRLKYGWRLQADPTVVFAWGDFDIRRVLNIHKMIDSPYNTYKYYGLPPGPICIPTIAAIDAVLNKEDNSYMYFCAKDDFSGYHVFASTNDQHIINANRYQRALDQLNIKN